MKNVFLLGDFSVDLLKNAEHAEQMNFLSHLLYICFYNILCIFRKYIAKTIYLIFAIYFASN